MTCVAIDPGSAHLGYAVYDSDRCLTDGVFHVKWELQSEFLAQLSAWVVAMCEQYAVQVIATEQMFTSFKFGGGANSAVLKIIPDELKAICARRKIHFVQYAPSSVKKHATGSGTAEKRDVVRAMVTHMTDESRALKPKVRENVADAHAVAWTAILNKYEPVARTKKRKRSRRAA